jgi:tRNA A-37 threonylcarbamoyl transferase component Bud32
MTRSRLAAIVAVAASFFAYFGLLVYCDLWRPEDSGFVADYTSNRMVLTRLVPNSPAERAGLRVHDVVTSADGKPIRTVYDWTVVDSNVVFDRPIALQIERNGSPVAASLVLRQGPWSFLRTGPGIFILVTLAIQSITLVLALIIVLKRPADPVARIGALLLATIGVFKIVLPWRIAAVWRDLPAVVGALFWLPHASDVAAGAMFFTFFASFPRRIIRSFGVWVLLWLPMAIALVKPLQYALDMVYAPERATGGPYQGQMLTAVTAFYIAAAIAALTINYAKLTDVNERRRVKILVIGAVGGLAPGFLVVAAYWLRSSVNETESIFASRITAIGTLSLLFFPTSFAYAILRHRLFDIRVMIRQGVQYAMARRVLSSLVPAIALLLGADVLLHSDQSIASLLTERGWMYLAPGGLALIARARRREWLNSLDRRFFREHYNAQQILRQVSDDVHTAGDVARAAPRVVAQIDAALHPEFTALLVREPDEVLYRVLAAVPAGIAPIPLRVDSTLVALLRVLGKPLEVTGGGQWLAHQLPPDEMRFLEESHIELLVPIVTRAERAESVLVLGVKRSEEPYTSQDRDLLATIAANLALMLERPALAPEPAAGAFEECPDCGSCYDSGTDKCAREGTALVAVQLSRVLAARYHLDRRLGQGGLGTVYAALDTALDRRVAVKVIRHDLVTKDDIARRFHVEARLAAAFVHPNVVTVHDFGVAGGRPFLVMELLDGTTLRDELQRQGPLPPAQAVRILRHVCAAVETAHRRQMVHRDLKPENIFLARSDAGEVAKVLDFGIAKMLADDNTGERTRGAIGTGPGVIVGTLRYMAPEQLRGEEVQHGADMWALGVIAYEMVTGHHPFAVVGPGGGTANPTGISPAVDRFFSQALAVDPSNRPTSAARFVDDLAAAIPGL